jgi:hypothetical protein
MKEESGSGGSILLLHGKGIFVQNAIAQNGEPIDTFARRTNSGLKPRPEGRGFGDRFGRGCKPLPKHVRPTGLKACRSFLAALNRAFLKESLIYSKTFVILRVADRRSRRIHCRKRALHMDCSDYGRYRALRAE